MTSPWGTRSGPGLDGGAYPVHLASKADVVGEGSAAAQLGPGPRLTVLAYPDVNRDHTIKTDVVVIGSGAGGAVVAKELAEAGLEVVVLEEGGYFTSDDFQDAPFLRFQRVAREAGTTQIWGRPPIPLPLGKAVGGSTVINSGTCWRTPDKVLDAWTSSGLEGVDPASMRPYFERVERIINVRPVPWELLGRNGQLTHDGVVKLGLSGGPLLRNITDCHGCGTCAMGCPSDAKQAMHVSYLPLAERAGSTIYARTRVDRITTRRGRAVGVTASVLDETDQARARLVVKAKVVVVAAGTIHTPVVLGRSGLYGGSGQLGRNLRIHPAVAVAGLHADEIRSWEGTLQPYFVDELFDSHDVMLETTSAVPSVAAGGLPGIGAASKDMIPGFKHVASIGLYVSDTSTGRVRRIFGRREPVLTYRMNEEDFRKLQVGMRLAAEIHLASGATAALVGLPGLPAVTKREDLDAITDERFKPSDVRPTAFHPMGTARMGAPEEGVVDAWGRHHDVGALWIADGSIFPSCVAVNPQVSIMAFATRTAEAIATAG